MYNSISKEYREQISLIDRFIPGRINFFKKQRRERIIERLKYRNYVKEANIDPLTKLLRREVFMKYLIHHIYLADRDLYNFNKRKKDASHILCSTKVFIFKMWTQYAKNINFEVFH